MAAPWAEAAVAVYARRPVAAADPSSWARTARERRATAAARLAPEVRALRPVVLPTLHDLAWRSAASVRQVLHDSVQLPAQWPARQLQARRFPARAAIRSRPPSPAAHRRAG